MKCDPFAGVPHNHFKAIVADPPWNFRSHTALQESNWESRRDAEKHYAVMNIGDIAALPVADLADAVGCHLFLWTTGPFFPHAIEIIKAWGFKYSSVAFTWVKLKRNYSVELFTESDLHVGLGHTTRKNAEFCLLARRGNCKRESKAVREIIMSPVREHSRKPDELYERVEQYCVGPYLDMFARQRRQGWTAWGNETDRFSAR